MPAPIQDGYSARAIVELIVDGRSIAVSQVGAGMLILRDSGEDIENRMGALSITVGSLRKRKKIMITRRSAHDPRELSFY